MSTSYAIELPETLRFIDLPHGKNGAHLFFPDVASLNEYLAKVASKVGQLAVEASGEIRLPNDERVYELNTTLTTMEMETGGNKHRFTEGKADALLFTDFEAPKYPSIFPLGIAAPGIVRKSFVEAHGTVIRPAFGATFKHHDLILG